jgi:FlaA1/EpsC-like NDP-sugar epimerase
MGIAPERFSVPTLSSARLNHRALRALPLSALGLDIALVSVTVFFAAFGRDHLDLFGSSAKVYETAGLVGVPLVIAWIGVTALRGGYDRGVFGAGADEYKVVVGSSLLTAAILGICCYLLKFELSRGFYLFTFLIGPPLLAVGRWMLRRWLHRARRLGSFGMRTVIVGSTDHIDAVASVFERESWLGYDVLGAVTPAMEAVDATGAAVRVLGEVHEAASLVRAYDADVVVVAGGGFENPTELRELVF